ncbi:MAG TPA: hypothetical protein VMG60_13030 [Burkholderiaceae bacterium]|nr:hypothetical protein [Burkholderiaceae bacterium]
MPLGRHLARLLAAGLLVFCAGAHAQFLYTCITKSGRRVSSDRPPPECADRTIHVLRPDGTPYRDIEPPLTPEQRNKQEEEEKRKLEEDDAKRAQVRSDRSLLETYASLEEIEAARKRAIADQQKLIDRALERKAELQRERKKLDDEAEFYIKRDMPEDLKRSFAANNESMKLQDQLIANTRAEMKRINERFDGFAKRFKELLDRGATPVQRPDQK